MDSFVTIRLPGFPLTDEELKPAGAPAQQSVSEIAISDEILLVQICQGNREALSLLFRRYARLVHSIAYRVLRDRSEADDLLQEVFLFVHRKSDTFDNSRSSGRSWIVQMTYHRAIDRRRHLQSRHFYTQVDLEQETEVLDSHAGVIEDNRLLFDLVGNTTIEGLLAILNEDQRNTLSLYFYEGYTFAEIAVKLDQSLGNIRNHYYRGLGKLRKQVFRGKLSDRNGCDKK